MCCVSHSCSFWPFQIIHTASHTFLDPGPCYSRVQKQYECNSFHRPGPPADLHLGASHVLPWWWAFFYATLLWCVIFCLQNQMVFGICWKSPMYPQVQRLDIPARCGLAVNPSPSSGQSSRCGNGCSRFWTCTRSTPPTFPSKTLTWTAISSATWVTRTLSVLAAAWGPSSSRESLSSSGAVGSHFWVGQISKNNKSHTKRCDFAVAGVLLRRARRALEERGPV